MQARWLVAALAILLIAACSPLGDDDDDDNPGPEATATREVTMATFTATEVVPPEEATATAEMRATESVATATARAALPTPTPAEIPDAPVLTPPQARIIAGSEQREGALGTYTWQFDDEAQTLLVIQAPTVQLGEELAIQPGDLLSLEIYGEAYRTPPNFIDIQVFDYEENRGTPVNPETGQPAEEEAFAIRTQPEMRMDIDSVEEPFALDGIEPGHYALWVQGNWGDHPIVPDQPLIVTWLFNIVVT